MQGGVSAVHIYYIYKENHKFEAEYCVHVGGEHSKSSEFREIVNENIYYVF